MDCNLSMYAGKFYSAADGKNGYKSHWKGKSGGDLFLTVPLIT